MNIIIKTKNIELTPSLENFTNEKIGKLEKFLPKAEQEVFVELAKESTHHKKGDVFMAEITIHLPGKSLVSRCHGEDLMKAIIEVKDQMEIEIKKYKTKMVEAPRREAKKFSEEEL